MANPWAVKIESSVTTLQMVNSLFIIISLLFRLLYSAPGEKKLLAPGIERTQECILAMNSVLCSLFFVLCSLFFGLWSLVFGLWNLLLHLPVPIAVCLLLSAFCFLPF